MGREPNHGFHSICALDTGKRDLRRLTSNSSPVRKTLFPTGMAPMERKLFVTGPRLAIPMFMYRRKRPDRNFCASCGSPIK